MHDFTFKKIRVIDSTIHMYLRCRLINKDALFGIRIVEIVPEMRMTKICPLPKKNVKKKELLKKGQFRKRMAKQGKPSMQLAL